MTREEILIFKDILPAEKLYALQKIHFRQENEAQRQRQRQNNPDIITIDKRQVKAEVEKVLNEVFKELGFK